MATGQQFQSAGNAPQTWPELAVGLYEQLTGHGAEITYDFENLEVEVPSTVGENSPHANWKINGTVKIHTRDLH